MAYLRPVVLLVILAACLAGAWLLGAGGERIGAPPSEGASVEAPAAEDQATGGPLLVGQPRSDAAPAVIVGAAAPPRSGQSPSGATEVLGVVIDDGGRPRHGGVVRAVRGGTLALLGEAPVVEGRFHLTLALESVATLILSYRDVPREGSRATLLFVAPGERWEGVELVSEPVGALEVEVTDASGAPAPDAVVEALTGPAIDVERLPLDAQGRTRLVLPALEHTWISATSPDGRFFVRENFSIEPGATTRVVLRLLGPWERLPVRVGSEPAHLRAGARASVTIGKRSPVEAEMEGGPVFVWVPPGEAGFHVDASLGDLGAGRFTVPPGRDERERALRDGVRVVVRLRAPLTVELVDARGRPLPGVRLGLNPWANDSRETAWGRSDAEGRVALGARVIGSDLQLAIESLPLGRVVVPPDGSPQRVVLPDPWTPVAGVIDPATPPGLVPAGVHLRVGGTYVSAPVDRTPRPDGYRWRAYVPFAAGAPLTAYAGDPLGPGVDGVCGQEDLRLSVRTGILEVAPRMGARLRPRGHLRIELLPLGSSRNEIGSVEVGPKWGFCPRWTGLAPGRYQVSWLPEGSKEWRVAPEPIEVQEGENRFEIDFGPP